MSEQLQIFPENVENYTYQLQDVLKILKELQSASFSHLSEEAMLSLLNLLSEVEETAQEAVETVQSDLIETTDAKWDEYRENLEEKFPAGSTLIIDRDLTSPQRVVNPLGKWQVREIGTVGVANANQNIMQISVWVVRPTDAKDLRRYLPKMKKAIPIILREEDVLHLLSERVTEEIDQSQLIDSPLSS